MKVIYYLQAKIEFEQIIHGVKIKVKTDLAVTPYEVTMTIYDPITLQVSSKHRGSFDVQGKYLLVYPILPDEILAPLEQTLADMITDYKWHTTPIVVKITISETEGIGDWDL